MYPEVNFFSSPEINVFGSPSPFAFTSRSSDPIPARGEEEHVHLARFEIRFVKRWRGERHGNLFAALHNFVNDCRCSITSGPVLSRQTAIRFVFSARHRRRLRIKSARRHVRLPLRPVLLLMTAPRDNQLPREPRGNH